MDDFLTSKKISVVIACYNEEKNIRPMYERLSAVFSEITPNYEFIYVDNCSVDNSRREYEILTQKDGRVAAIIMSRNFGSSDTSYSAGSEYATGDAVVWIDGDIEDPPEMIKDFVKKWLEGYEVVYGIRKKRKAGWLLRFGAKFFYRILNKISYLDMPVDAGDFSLMDRRVVDVLGAMPERDRFVRGLRTWTGFRQIGIPYAREGRKTGVSTQGLISYLHIAKKGIFSFSYSPLSLLFYLASISFILTVIASISYIISSFFLPAPPGFLTLLTIILFIGSIQFLCFAIIGEYIGRIFEEVKGRPKYVIREILKK